MHTPVDSKPAAKSSLAGLTLGALGVVYGDIGTSPLYAFKEAFSGPHAMPIGEQTVLAALSLIFWSVTLVVSLKYLVFVLRFDNKGEGGVLALLAFAQRQTRKHPRLNWTVAMIGIFAASLFYGDAIITPAISVLSAIEGISVATPVFERWVIPLTICILAALFAIQSRGTGSVGALFGPITVVWFLVLAALGAQSILETPVVIRALDPRHAFGLALDQPGMTFLVLGAVFLAITGAEALYADMGHFGRKPIQLAWFALVFPALMINYFGQGALVLRDPQAIKNPFYLLAPQELLLPMVALATAATVIASQATISGAFSITQQASRLGFLPRIPVRYTSDVERGQIYIGRVNWLMLILVVLLVLGFKSSGALAAAYGIAVSGTMVLTTTLVVIVLWSLSGFAKLPTLVVLIAIGAVELLFLGSNATKIVEGGWFPLLCGAAVFTLLTTWKTAAGVIRAKEAERRVPIGQFLQSLGPSIARVPGTAVYFAADPDNAPSSLLHNLKHYKAVHERMVFLTIVDEDVPRLPDVERTWVDVIERGRIYQATLRFGFREEPDVLRALNLLARHGLTFDLNDTTFFIGKTTIAKAIEPGLFTWRRDLFRWMQRNSLSVAEYFKLPPGRVVELGTQISI